MSSLGLASPPLRDRSPSRRMHQPRQRPDIIRQLFTVIPQCLYLGLGRGI
jgi:hypothetical protein